MSDPQAAKAAVVDDEPKTPMWLPALGAALFAFVGLWWAVTPSSAPPADADQAASASAAATPPPPAPTPTPPPPQPVRPAQPVAPVVSAIPMPSNQGKGAPGGGQRQRPGAAH